MSSQVQTQIRGPQLPITAFNLVETLGDLKNDQQLLRPVLDLSRKLNDLNDQKMPSANPSDLAKLREAARVPASKIATLGKKVSALSVSMTDEALKAFKKANEVVFSDGRAEGKQSFQERLHAGSNAVSSLQSRLDDAKDKLSIVEKDRREPLDSEQLLTLKSFRHYIDLAGSLLNKMLAV